MCFVGCYFLLKTALRIPLNYVRYVQCFLGVFLSFSRTFSEKGCLWVVILFGHLLFLKRLTVFCGCYGFWLGWGLFGDLVGLSK